jgi:hypothetical protein
MLTVNVSEASIGQLTELARGLFALETDLMDYHQPLEEIKNFSIHLWDNNFVSEGGALDEPWAALAPSTIKDRQKKGYNDQKLVRTQKLYDRFEELNNEGKVGLRTLDWTFTNGNDGFPVRHDEGYANPNPRGGGGPIPARNLWGYTEADVSLIVDEIEIYIMACINRRLG